jgi:alkylation response protein AidB-like acyl-CoA dehydrogenase
VIFCLNSRKQARKWVLKALLSKGGKAMDFSLTEQNLMYQKIAREFAEKEIFPQAAAMDASGEFPHGVIKKMAEAELFGISVPQEYGGLGLDNISCGLIVEEIAKACATISLIHHTPRIAMEVLLKFGTDEQKKKFIPPLARGEYLATFACTEAQGSSDILSATTLAEKKGNEYVLKGRKAYITNAATAHYHFVFARTQAEGGPKGFGMFVVEKDRPGFSVGKREKTLGFRGSTLCELAFKDVVVPVENLIAKEGMGLRIAVHGLEYAKPYFALIAVGVAQAALGASIKYAKERHTFGKPLGQHQAIQFYLADMAAQVESVRLLCHKALCLEQAGQPADDMSTMAKIMCGDMAMRVTEKALQIHGSAGYCEDFPVERYFREAKSFQFTEGSAEMMRMVLARKLLR